MQIGIDLGATKIESVILDDNGKEVHRSREKSPSNYDETIISIKNKIDNLEEKFNRSFDVGVCHPGSISNETGLLKNANNSPWLNNKKFQKDISKTLNKNVICENDANCFALSEAFDGSAKNYNIVFGIILGSGCGGGLIINKEIVKGSNYLTGEWGHNPLPYYGMLDDEKIDINSGTIIPNIDIEKYISGKGLENLFYEKYNKKLSAKDIFKKEDEYEELIKNFYNRLARSLAIIINTIDPEVIIFGGGISNEIENLEIIKEMTGNFSGKGKINTNFLKPMYGDASGVRGAARLGRKINY